MQDPEPPAARPRTLMEDVHDRLLAMILSDELPADARVNVYALAKRLDVSPTPIREALALLEDTGLVEKIHLKGYRTTPVLTRRELDDLYGLRLLLEPATAAAAARTAAPETVAALREELRAYTDVAGDAPDRARFGAHDRRLHALIARAAGNDAVARALARTHFHLHAFRLSYDAQAGRTTVGEHARIVEAIADADPDAAERAMRAHLENARERLLPRARQS